MSATPDTGVTPWPNGLAVVGDGDGRHAAELRNALASTVSQIRTEKIEDRAQAARRAAADIAVATLGAMSVETATHSDDVDVISEALGRKLGLTEKDLDDLMLAARLHDIGKVDIPPSILHKPGPLDDSEWKVIRRHTIVGDEIVRTVPELASAATLVRYSHERWDGTGYPDGLREEQIPLGSRIIFCADAFHAMRSDRPYRQGRSAAEALAVISDCAGTQFDPNVASALRELAREYRQRVGTGRRIGGRAGRLTALLLVLGVGATAAASVKSGGLFDSFPPAPSGTAVERSSAVNAAGDAGESANTWTATFNGPWGREAQNDSSNRVSAGVRPGKSGALQSGPTSGPPGAAVQTNTAQAVEAPTAGDNGVRDHGQGVGNGKGNGKGSENGVRDHGQGVGNGKGKGANGVRDHGEGVGKGKSKGKGPAQGSPHQAHTSNKGKDKGFENAPPGAPLGGAPNDPACGPGKAGQVPAPKSPGGGTNPSGKAVPAPPVVLPGAAGGPC